MQTRTHAYRSTDALLHRSPLKKSHLFLTRPAHCTTACLHAHNRVIVANVGAPFNAASNRSTFFQIKLCRSEEYALLSPPSDVLPYRGQPVPAVCDSALNRVCSYVNMTTAP